MACLLLGRDEAVGAEPFSHVGSYAFTFAGMPRGVRNLAMGSTGTASLYEHSTGFFNPASLAWTNAWTLQASHEGWPADITLSDICIAGAYLPDSSSESARWRFGGSLGYSGLWMEPQVVRTVYLPEGTGETFDADDHMLSATVAAAWEGGAFSLGVGGTAKYLRSEMAASNVSSWAFDGGMVIALPIAWRDAVVRPRAGVAILNRDTGASYDDRSFGVENVTRTALGVDVATPLVSVGNGAWKRSVSPLAISFDYDWANRESGTDPESFGVAVSFLGTLEARVGQVTVEGNRAESRAGFGLGWDFGPWLFQFDYAQINGISSFVLDRDCFGLIVGARFAP
jgi:hypothetical protein